MRLRALVPILVLSVANASASFATPVFLKWPPWISIESPVNPFDASAKDAAFLVHAAVREGMPTIADVSGTAEGLVNGVRKSVPLRIDTTSRPGVFAVRRQWPAEGTWVLRIKLLTTTAIVNVERDGRVGAALVPTSMQSGLAIPRTVSAREIDAMLSDAARR